MLPYGDWVLGSICYNRERERIYMKKGGVRKAVVLSKVIMEVHLGRYLEEDEVVHHKDGDKYNNELCNLEVMNRRDHLKLHNIKEIWGIKVFVCEVCGKQFSKGGDTLKWCYRHRLRGNVGPFCSRGCVITAKNNMKYSGKEYVNQKFDKVLIEREDVK